MEHFLKGFLPQISQDDLMTLVNSLTLSMHGFNFAISQCFHYKNLLEQGTKNYQSNFGHSKKFVKWSEDNFPEAKFMEPLGMEV